MMWLKFIRDDDGLRADYAVFLAQRREDLRTEICDPNTDDDKVRLARGALAEIERMRRELTAEEKEHASRKSYDARSGRPVSDASSVRPIRRSS